MCAFMFRPDERFNLISFAIMQSMLRCVHTTPTNPHEIYLRVCI